LLTDNGKFIRSESFSMGIASKGLRVQGLTEKSERLTSNDQRRTPNENRSHPLIRMGKKQMPSRATTNEKPRSAYSLDSSNPWPLGPFSHSTIDLSLALQLGAPRAHKRKYPPWNHLCSQRIGALVILGTHPRGRPAIILTRSLMKLYVNDPLSGFPNKQLNN
jgi:hypothetical protein